MFARVRDAFGFAPLGSVLLLLALIPAVFGQTSRKILERGKEHWAFQPVKRPALPEVKNGAWAQTSLDRFVLAKLEANGLRPALPASRAILARRVFFDLTGLPPAPEELSRFLEDGSVDAFPRLVDRLLASREYGERWGRHWLDVARYADNKGYVFFEEKTFPWAWTYRDYVVRAFNEDKPFDRFVLEQLAADQLSLEPSDPALAATGFVTVGDHFSNNTHDILDDRIDVVSRGLLGLTVACARCHDHKFDPIGVADYYALYGIFRSSQEPLRPPALESLPLREESEEYELELQARERRLRDFVESKHREILQSARSRLKDYLLAAHAQRNQPSTESFMLIADQGDLNPTVLARWRNYLERMEPSDPVWGPWAEFAQATNFEAAVRDFQGSPQRTGLNPIIAAAFAEPPLKSMEDVASKYAKALASADSEWKRGDAATRTRADLLQLRQCLYGSDAPPDVPAQMDWGFLSLLPDRASQGEFQKLLKAHEEWISHAPHAPPRAMALQDAPEPYEPRVFRRGNPNRLGSSVPRRFLEVLNPSCRPFERGSGRLELARSICDPKNPLTARVIVNRIWMHHFGAGLAGTPSDFGLRSAAPSHLELLDWLASEFIESGWRLKHMHRLILNSAVYQQSSLASDPSVSSRDPENRLLSHMNRRRHDFETQRDSVLAVSGKLNLRPGGPPVEANAPRRTLYTFVDRLDVPPLRATFDFPSPSASCPQRVETTVPPQALYFMNNAFAAEAAEALLRRPDVAGLPLAKEKIARLCLLCFARPPTGSEVEHALRFLGPEPSEEKWRQYAHALLMTNEFVFVD